MSERHPNDVLRELFEEEPDAHKVLQDAKDLNEMIETGDVDPGVDGVGLKSWIDTFDSEWPYLQKPVTFTGKVRIYPTSEFGTQDIPRGTYANVDGGSAVSYGFVLYKEAEDANVRVMQMIGFDMDPESRIVLPDDSGKFDYKAVAEVGDIFMQHYKEDEYDASEYVQHYMPEISEEIDSRILNTENEIEVVDSLKGFEIYHGVGEKDLSRQHHMLDKYVNEVVAFEEIVPYSAAIRGPVHLVDESGSIGNMQKIIFDWQQVLLVPDRVTFIPKYSYGEGQEPRFLYDTSVPALVCEIFDTDTNKHYTTDSLDVVIPITDDLILASNVETMQVVETPEED